MRSALLALAASSFLAACTIETTETSGGGGYVPDAKTPSGTLPPAAPKAPSTPSVTEPDDGVMREVVHVYMTAHDATRWYCTGTLIAKDKVVTAAHCLEPAQFESYEIVASLAPGAPRITARAPKLFGGSFEDVANPDIGFLTLDSPVVLARYAELTDVVAAVEAGEAVTAAPVVRTTQDPTAQFAEHAHLPVSSTVGFGYEHGFGTPMFSKGGDSGSGLFLVENGKITHKLIGVARQPEPVRDLDHFTRVGADFKTWYAAQIAE